MEEIEFLCDSRFLIALAEEETKSIEKAEEEVGSVIYRDPQNKEEYRDPQNKGEYRYPQNKGEYRNPQKKGEYRDPQKKEIQGTPE